MKTKTNDAAPTMGRPVTVGGKRRNLYLSDDDMQFALEVGGGDSASEGIRVALAALRKSMKAKGATK